MLLRSSGLSDVLELSGWGRNSTCGEAIGGGAGGKNVATGRFRNFATLRSSVADGFAFRFSQAFTSTLARADRSSADSPDSDTAQLSTSVLMFSFAMAGSGEHRVAARDRRGHVPYRHGT